MIGPSPLAGEGRFFFSLPPCGGGLGPFLPPPLWGRAGVGGRDFLPPHPNLPPPGGRETVSQGLGS